MTQIISTHTRSVATATLLLLLAGLALTACGGSSSTSSATTKTASTSTTKSKAAAGNQPAALRACLQEAGIPLSKEITGQNSSIAGILASLPKGVTRAQLLAAVSRCGGLSGNVGNLGSGARTSSTAYKQAFVKFASCMRANGVNMPAPNTSGKGPLLNTKGLDTTSATYKAAAEKCAPIVRKVLALPVVPTSGAKR